MVEFHKMQKVSELRFDVESYSIFNGSEDDLGRPNLHLGVKGIQDPLISSYFTYYWMTKELELFYSSGWDADDDEGSIGLGDEKSHSANPNDVTLYFPIPSKDDEVQVHLYEILFGSGLCYSFSEKCKWKLILEYASDQYCPSWVEKNNRISNGSDSNQAPPKKRIKFY